MLERLEQELALLRKTYPNLEYDSNGHWIRIRSYPLPAGWNRQSTDVAFQVPTGYPGTPPYGIYVPTGIGFRDEMPGSYKEPADNRPPFAGTWGIFSWQPKDWRATTDLNSGHNLFNWVTGFAVRFKEGK